MYSVVVVLPVCVWSLLYVKVALADLGGMHGACPPPTPRSIFFRFDIDLQNFRNVTTSGVNAPHPTRSTPTYGKSWTRHCVESYKWEAGFYIYTPVTQQLSLLDLIYVAWSFIRNTIYPSKEKMNIDVERKMSCCFKTYQERFNQLATLKLNINLSFRYSI